MGKLYTPGTWTDEILAGAERYDILNSSGSTLYEDVQINLATPVAVAGTEQSAALMNNIEDGLDALDTKVAAMEVHSATNKTTPVDADEVGLWDSISATMQKLTWANLKASLKAYFDTLYSPVTGWVPYSGTWTYASASSFTVSGDQTAVFQVDTKLKLTQTTVKYFAVSSSSYSAGTGLTTVNVIGGGTYTLASAAITSPYYSYAYKPQGWSQAIGSLTAVYTTNAGQTIATASVTVVDYEDKEYDPNGRVATGASWAYTVLIAGDYRVSAGLRMAYSTTWADGEPYLLYVYKNGAVSRILARIDSMGSANISPGISGSALLTNLAVGDTIDIRVYQNSGGNLNIDTTAGGCFVDIARVT